MTAGEVAPMTRRLGLPALCLLFVSQTLTGCASWKAVLMSGGGGAAIGAGAGVLGGVSARAMVTVVNDSANLREGPGEVFRVVSTVPRGTELAAIDAAGPEQDRWYKVKLADGREAWVAASVVSRLGKAAARASPLVGVISPTL